MRGRVLFVAATLAACGSSEQPSEAPEPTSAALTSSSPSAPPSGPFRDYAPPQLTPDAEKAEKGARNLLLAWASAMEDRAFEAAYRLFGDYGDRTGTDAAEYAATFADYRTVTVAIGEGAVEGACGSSYYEAPVTLSGTTQSGETYVRNGTIVLRRVNDVPGATPAQLRWHLERLEWNE